MEIDGEGKIGLRIGGNEGRCPKSSHADSREPAACLDMLDLPDVADSCRGSIEWLIFGGRTSKDRQDEAPLWHHLPRPQLDSIAFDSVATVVIL